MKKSERFKSMDEVHTEKARLQAAREGYRHNLKEHWTVLGEKEFRRGLVGDFFGELLSAWRPAKSIMAFMDKRPQTLAHLASNFLGHKKDTVWGKALMWGLTAASPYITEKISGNRTAGTLMDEVQRSWERIKDYVRRRKEARQNGMHEHEVHNGMHA